jgi:excisionase family DNA binding protein
VVLYPIGQAADRLNVSRWTLARWLADGEVRCVELGGRRYIPASELERLNRPSAAVVKLPKERAANSSTAARNEPKRKKGPGRHKGPLEVERKGKLYYAVERYAQKDGITKEQGYRRLSSGKVPYIVVDGKRFVPASELDGGTQ